jgi:hypothetical protein
VLGVPFAPAWYMVRSMQACLTTLIKQSCGIERLHVKNRDYIRGLAHVKRKTSYAEGVRYFQLMVGATATTLGG